MKIPVTEDLVLDTFNEGDAADIHIGIDDPMIFENTLNVPSPYTLQHAEDWIKFSIEQNSKSVYPEHLCFRLKGKAIGGIGMIKTDKVGYTHQVEIGYWIVETERGKGYTPAAIKAYCDYIFSHFNYVKICATVYDENTSSQKAIIKAGFAEEAFLKMHIKKNNTYKDCKIYTLYKPEI
ncbi:MAG: GNAT family protein [Bacteroidetes bacterium]|nr:GNAT family protein [Bacteroidota bacterium]